MKLKEEINRLCSELKKAIAKMEKEYKTYFSWVGRKKWILHESP
jgi:hypothetical protein